MIDFGRVRRNSAGALGVDILGVRLRGNAIGGYLCGGKASTDGLFSEDFMGSRFGNRLGGSGSRRGLCSSL